MSLSPVIKSTKRWCRCLCKKFQSIFTCGRLSNIYKRHLAENTSGKYSKHSSTSEQYGHDLNSTFGFLIRKWENQIRMQEKIAQHVNSTLKNVSTKKKNAMFSNPYTCIQLYNSRASTGLQCFLRKHLAWWKNTVDCLLTVLVKDYFLPALLPAMFYSPSFTWSLQSIVYRTQTPVCK